MGDKSQSERIHDLVNVIVQYARLEFEAQVPVSERGDDIDALAAGINMLGEELNETTISLNEKENLLREIHHRIKNNLQIISSLMNLQIQQANDPKFIDYARETQNRIRAIAVIHEMLYKSIDNRHTSLDSYTKTLVDMLMKTYTTSEHSIEVELDIDSKLAFTIDEMIPIGLIVNEVVSNSLKYAFPVRKGKILIKSSVDGDRNFLTISDDGVGLSKSFDESKDVNLGMQLIDWMAQQAEIDIQRFNGSGLRYELTF